MKSEQQIREKYEEVVRAYDKVSSADYSMAEYLIGMMEILDWVLTDN